MQTSPTHSRRRLRDYTSTPLEVFIAVFTIAPFFVLAYFYQSLSAQVPLFLNLSGEVETWVEKNVMSVFRVPLAALITQVVLLIVKYATVQSKPPFDLTNGQAQFQEQYLNLSIGLWDWFRWAAAFKMIAQSLDTIFLSVERYKYLARPAFIVSAIGAALGVVGALVYLYRLLVVSRAMKAQSASARVERPLDAEHVYGGIVYFNPSDPAVFVSKHVLNFGNKWVWVLIASVIAYPLVIFWPA